MSSNQQPPPPPPPKGFALSNGLTLFNPQVVRAVFSEKKHKSLEEVAVRRTSNVSPSNVNPPVTRTSSMQSVTKQVGSSRFFLSSKK